MEQTLKKELPSEKDQSKVKAKTAPKERLLHYVWKHKLFPLAPLSTTDGQRVEVIDPGLHNTNAGPDFFNAKVRVGDTLWVGNVELHTRASDWFLHRHDRDAAYDNVVLHVVEEDDGCRAITSAGDQPPQMVLPVPGSVKANYEELLRADSYPPCHRVIGLLPRLTQHSWMSALQTERLQQKTEAIDERARKAGGSWEQAFFTTLARNFGFGVNGDAFETWAAHLPLYAAAHHRDDPFQVEALFLGQAGLLNVAAVAEHRQLETASDGYFQRLSREYGYLAHKFSLTPMNGRLWRFLRLRPQNFHYIRISQLVTLYCSRRCSLSQMADCQTPDDARQMLSTEPTPYWHTHYTFGNESKASDKRLSRSSTDLLIINTVVPMLYAYGRHTAREQLCDRAFRFLEQLKAEDNSIVRMWRQCGLSVENAGDTQALIQLKRHYCDRKDCLRCRFGYEYLKVKK